MIYLYSGTPGSGKSTHAAQTILDAVARKHPPHIIVNFEVNADILGDKMRLIRYVPNYELSVEFLKRASRELFGDRRVSEGEILLVIDEAQLIFSPMVWQKTFSDGWQTFFTQHRKFGFDIILITQVDRMLNRSIRGLIEYEYIHRKVKNLGGFWGWFLSLVIGRFYVVETWYQVRNLRTGGHGIKYSKRAFQLFDTFKSWE